MSIRKSVNFQKTIIPSSLENPMIAIEPEANLATVMRFFRTNREVLTFFFVQIEKY